MSLLIHNLRKDGYRISSIIYCRTVIRSPSILNHHPCGYLLQCIWILWFFLCSKQNHTQCTCKLLTLNNVDQSSNHWYIWIIRSRMMQTSCACFNSEAERKFSSPKGSSIWDAIWEPKQNTSFFSRYDLDSEFPFTDPSTLALVIFVHPIPCNIIGQKLLLQITGGLDFDLKIPQIIWV